MSGIKYYQDFNDFSSFRSFRTILGHKSFSIKQNGNPKELLAFGCSPADELNLNSEYKEFMKGSNGVGLKYRRKSAASNLL